MKKVFKVSLLLIISEVLSQIHLFLYSEKLSLQFEAVDQQKTLLDHQETRLPSYWNLFFSKICLAMKIGHEVNAIVINKDANSLNILLDR